MSCTVVKYPRLEHLGPLEGAARRRGQETLKMVQNAELKRVFLFVSIEKCLTLVPWVVGVIGARIAPT